jgi:cellulase
MKLLSSYLATALAITSVTAHATFQELWVGTTDEVGTCVRAPASNSPVTSVTSNDIACNAGAAASPGYCTAAAGGQVSVEMHQQVSLLS